MKMNVKTHQTSVRRLHLLAAASLWILGCSHLPSEEYADSADPAVEIKKLEGDLASAKASQVNMLSPTYYRVAAEKLEEAKKDRSDGDDNADVLESVSESRANLTKANDVAKVAGVTLAGPVKARADALAAGADAFAKEEFAAVDSDMKGLTEDIENGDIKSAEKGSGELQKTYLALELAAIKDKNIGHAKRTVASAIKEGAEDDAKRTLAVAQNSVKEAETYINGNRHDVAGIEARSAVATANAERLLKITRDTKVAGNKDSEMIILEMEAEQKKVAAKAAALATATGSVAKLKGEKADLASQTENLEADRDFNARVESIKARFSPAEAEVYKDGDQVLIRLKSLAFPVGQAMISEANFPLLGKVQQALIDLGSGSVTINGHTDATGSKATNQKLSVERATAVRAYFVASGKIPAANVMSEGFGDTKPIASNKTAAGRAQNRRVDILIAPNRASMVF